MQRHSDTFKSAERAKDNSLKEGSLKQMHHTQKLGPESFNSGSIKNDGSFKSAQENNSSPDFKKAHS